MEMGHNTSQKHGIELELIEVTDPTQYPVVIHGTYNRCIQAILYKGLSKMGRNHIHFAPGMPGADDVISGMRASCQVVIQIDLALAMQDGYHFYLSDNNVILCPGNENGMLPKKYFKSIVDRKSGVKIPIC
ncbi:tRNA 2'-phosphotransferase 1-like isoform X1 [Oopsacas minuta]|uniref:tRNA 2'-phosphotransferase 1-like isoform X1 n=1 Tax=Oopsacas minuta TaxID=111878 RepID=A0AAV7JC34_9METZ|nr:tRNA 2'-phosphotransferase 1-like isoform X1 [Oopsacas minuta]